MESKRNKILKAALNLLNRNGVHATPMAAIAKEAGTGMGTIYNYFANKEVLINEIYLDIKKMEATLFPPFDENEPIKTQFENYYQIVIQFYVNNPADFQFLEQVYSSPIITDESRAIGLKAVLPVFQLIEIGQKNRVIKSINTSEIMQFVGGSVLAFSRWFIQDEKKDLVSMENQLRMVWDAIKE